LDVDGLNGAATTISYGKPGDDVFVGDWDGNGTDTFAVRRGNIFYLRNRLGSGAADVVIGYGTHGDEVLVGDWDGNGTDTPGMYRPSNGLAYLTNDTPPDGGVGVGDPDLTFFFGIPGDEVVVGDWDGDGFDTLGIHRGGKMFLTNVNGTSIAEWDFFFGTPGDIAFGGDADGDGRDSVFLYRPSSGFVYFTTEIPIDPSGAAATAGTLFFGEPTDRFVVGDWDGDGIDTVGVFRPPSTTHFLRNSNTTGPGDITFDFGSSTWIPVAGDF
ncbi:MAG: hypothetical protein HKN80_06200, partial [Acidimicrobiia bacterium]|nr:hypothetical protein [Acidimicrobiia bacterium]